MNGVFEETLEGLTVRTGDIIGTVDGNASLYGLLFKIIGEIVPGRPDHIAIYLGPDGICVEAAPRGVNLFRFFGGRWDTKRMQGQRDVVDSLYGVGSLLQGRFPNPKQEEDARETVRSFVLDQIGKRYNMNFLDVDSEEDFYCSQLAYAAYKRVGLDMNVAAAGSLHPKFLNRIVTPEEVWNACCPRQETGQ